MLRKYLRECVTRDQAIGSPWLVKAELAERYHVSHEMSEEIRERNAALRVEMVNKRKKPKHEEEDEDEIDLGSSNKKQKVTEGGS
jgi:bromodomain adjacent to zinc finger domain protein 1A